MHLNAGRKDGWRVYQDHAEHRSPLAGWELFWIMSIIILHVKVNHRVWCHCKCVAASFPPLPSCSLFSCSLFLQNMWTIWKTRDTFVASLTVCSTTWRPRAAQRRFAASTCAESCTPTTSLTTRPTGGAWASRESPRWENHWRGTAYVREKDTWLTRNNLTDINRSVWQRQVLG